MSGSGEDKKDHRNLSATAQWETIEKCANGRGLAPVYSHDGTLGSREMEKHVSKFRIAE